ncbi:putative plant organelle RNA recognition domain-containing protein [Rosa chinensis]|uniref:Putative plant organelle RNA recognition domain-containing protein n=1 Tax=Rosa chinensis TaxID=74649 RepID=A0A2P6SEB4_ROSCH|nr:protein WHAT'S THIS FACTOR 9, mitochondrial [Rosa chinensis]XP_024171616.1 protein WHAT'S THIS FACTOR 9, mitochondrial [Rosa chinensis]XP_024171624.1 protein WHAT'S THIS FACTOR 9, mitochondrial [Rosa chinensis]XP_024171629.1 protein WHAT'S THIS FACTOR 9, mitochondrial [Rosa chinensis]XP_024171634.1 protein WHAT'S THIS FACTOR 9, mitochondrial [Rosa chinensis]PRQ57016.1 putative plant organelle RNA recognition domain-containing protein [Rosa chinensis]
MLLTKPTSKPLRKLLFPYQNSILSSLYRPQNPAYTHTQKSNYVNVYMKWKKDSYFDSIEHIDKSIVLKPIINLKNCITEDPNGCIPIYEVSKKGLQLDVPMKVAKFLRKYPSIFEEFAGEYNHPWFKLTPEAAEIDREEKRVYQDCRVDLRYRLKKLILMSKEKVLPLKIIQGMEWFLGLPDDFLHYPEKNLDGSFRFVTMEDGLEGLAVDSGEKVLSAMQRNAMKKGVYSGAPTEAIEFPLFPSKGLRLRNKIEDWLKEFQKLPYVSPYEDFSHLLPDTDASEKRVVGLLHELLSLFVEHSAERKKLKCLKKYMGLPQKVHRAFERHPGIFYLSFKNKTCTVILKEAYCDESAIEKHPLLEVRKKYIRLMRESAVLLKNRRVNGRLAGGGNMELDLDLEPKIEDRGDGGNTEVDLDLDSENDQRDGECSQ